MPVIHVIYYNNTFNMIYKYTSILYNETYSLNKTGYSSQIWEPLLNENVYLYNTNYIYIFNIDT